MKLILCYLFLLINISIIFAFNPTINKDEYEFIKADEGYELFIKKKDNINSILLTESQKWPDNKITNYGLRTTKYYEANSDEKRILDGKELSTKYDAFFLVDSTTEIHPELGEVYRYYLPETVVFGYDWTRNGELTIKNGVHINLRMFEKPYADYDGDFKDQWIKLELTVKSNNYNQTLIKDMKKISKKTLVKEPEQSNEDFFKEIPKFIPITPKADIMILLDTTASMRDELPDFIHIFPYIYKEIGKKIKDFEIGFTLYRDYGDKYLLRDIPLTSNLKILNKELAQVKAEGGQDIPEALNEARYHMKNIDFRTNSKKYAIIIADAPAHPTPRKDITSEMADEVFETLNIELYSMCFPFK